AVTTPMMSIGPKLGERQAASYYGSTFLQQICVGLGFALLLALYALVGPYLGLDSSLEVMVLPLALCLVLTQVQDFLRRYCLTVGRASVVMLSDVIRYAGQLTHLFLTFRGTLLTADVSGVLW